MSNQNVCVNCEKPSDLSMSLCYENESQDVFLCMDCMVETAMQHSVVLPHSIEQEIQALKNGYMPIEYFHEEFANEAERIEYCGPDWRKGFDQVDLDWLDDQPPFVKAEAAL